MTRASVLLILAAAVTTAACASYAPVTAPTAPVALEMSTPAAPAPTPAPTPAPPLALAPERATYDVGIDATWSATTHPTDFPDGVSHFSQFIGGTHSSGVTFWSEGQLASVGIQAMAEVGDKSRLGTEVSTAIAAGKAESVISAGGIGRSPGNLSISFEVSKSFPLVTLVTMLAPSPDWFMGVSGLALYENNAWKDEVRVVLYPMDAGTDSGSSFRSPDEESRPHVPIFRITGYPFAYQGTVAPIGTMTFRKR